MSQPSISTPRKRSVARVAIPILQKEGSTGYDTPGNFAFVVPGDEARQTDFSGATYDNGTVHAAVMGTIHLYVARGLPTAFSCVPLQAPPAP